MFHSIDQVHSKQTGDQRGEHQDNGDTGKHLHDAAHVVVDNVGIRVHCGIQDVGVDIGGFSSLTHLDVDILDHVGIQLIDGQFEFQLREQVFVASDGSDEIGQTVLQTAEVDEVGIVDVLVEVLLGR